MALDEAVRGGQHDDAAGGLGDRNVQAGRRLGHHHAAQEHAEIVTVAPPAASMTSPMVMPTGTRSVTGVGHRAGHGEVFVRHRLIEADVDQRLDIGDGYVHILGQAAGRNDAAGDEVNQDEFIACRVDIRQGHNPHTGGAMRSRAAMISWYLSLTPMAASAAPTSLHGHAQAAQKRLGVVMQQLLVFVQQGLAFSGVDDHQRDPGFELHSRGKAAAARAHNAQLAHASGGYLPRTWQICTAVGSLQHHFALHLPLVPSGEILKVVHNSD